MPGVVRHDMRKDALIISNGPSGQFADRFDLEQFAYVIGVNGRATEYPCTHWVIRDPIAFNEWAGRVIGSPILVCSRNVGLLESLFADKFPDAFPMFRDWPAGKIWLDDLAVPHPTPRAKPKWFQWSGVAALGFAATLDVDRIEVVGADMGGDGGGSTAGHGDRSTDRWDGEWKVWHHNAAFAKSKGIALIRHTNTGSVYQWGAA